jgi:FKBP-type peptidyl-prolyl cis-trans isomerase (trigger factor)
MKFHVKIHEISWKIVTEINESLLKTQYPQRELTRNDTLDQTFWVSKIPKRLVDRIFT